MEFHLQVIRKPVIRSGQTSLDLLLEVTAKKIALEKRRFIVARPPHVNLDKIIRKHDPATHALPFFQNFLQNRQANFRQFRSVLGRKRGVKRRFENRFAQPLHQV